MKLERRRGLAWAARNSPGSNRYALTVSRVIAWLLLVVGLALTVLGAALVLNLASLRDLVDQTRFHPAIEAVFDVRDEMSHRRAQSLELASGLSGMGLLGFSIWLLRRPAAR
jgi:hypothetical protein